MNRIALLAVITVALGTAGAGAAEEVRQLPNSVANAYNSSTPYNPLTGTVKEVDAARNRLDVQDDMGGRVDLTLDKVTQVTRDGRAVALAELVPGDHIVVNTPK